MSRPENTADQFIDLIQRFVQLRPRLVIPEHIARFKKQLESSRQNGKSDPEDRFYFIRIFIMLSRSQNPPTMGEISAELGIPLSTATRIMDRLVQAGFIQRVNDPSDRRVVRVQMTEHARQFYQTAMDYNKKRIAHLIRKFSSEERSQILHLMGKLLDTLEEES